MGIIPPPNEEIVHRERMKGSTVEPPLPESIRETYLRTAANLTAGDRDKEYGDPMVNLNCASDLKQVFWAYAEKGGRTISNAEREALDMVLTKLSRLACGPKCKPDTYVDGAAYFAIAGEAAFCHERGMIGTSGFARNDRLGREPGVAGSAPTR